MKKVLLTGAAGGLLWATAFTGYAINPLVRWLIGLAALTTLFSLWAGPLASSSWPARREKRAYRACAGAEQRNPGGMDRRANAAELPSRAARRNARAAAAGGFAFGMVAFSVACHWIYYSVRIVNGGPVALAAALVALLAAFMACWYALGGYWAARLAPRRGWLAPVVVLPAVLALTEWLRGWVLTGFPWLSAGYLTGPVLAGKLPTVLASAGGVYLVSWITAVLAGACLMIWRWRMAATRRVAMLAVLLGGVAALGQLPFPEGGMRPAGELRVRLVQGGIPQERKWLPEEYEPTLLTYELLSFGQPWQDAPDQRPELIIWPEVAIPATQEFAADYLFEADALMQDRGSALALGILTSTAEGRFNSLMVLGNGEGVYHKSHLVPFGEFFPIPDAMRDWLQRMGLPASDLIAGLSGQSLLRAAGAAFGASICYEAAFGAEQRAWAPDAELLVNVSNDGWFGDTVALEQHLDMARLRAMEAGRYLLRATGTGITAAIDPAGRIVARLPKHEAGFLDVHAPRLSGATLYTRYGDRPVVILCLLLGVALPIAIRLMVSN